jgi:hypothetical protein
VGKRAAESADPALSASVQVLPLPTGLYLFSVTAADRTPANASEQLALPAVNIGLGPGVKSDDVDFVAGPSTHGAWLFTPGDLLIAKVKGPGATLILTSVRGPGGEVLSIKVERLDTRVDVLAQTRAAPVLATDRGLAPSHEPARQLSSVKAVDSADNVVVGAVPIEPSVPIQIEAHIRAAGDMTFSDAPWAGRVAPGLWIESFSVRPLERFCASDIEYKGLTGSGFETPWLSDDKVCGTKGMSVPLVGFAVRLKASAATAIYDCEYSGYFQSGATVGPQRNGAPCRSSVANDPLEGIQVRIVKRTLKSSAARGVNPVRKFESTSPLPKRKPASKQRGRP